MKLLSFFLISLCSTSAFGQFIWPEKGVLNPDNLKEYANEYSKEVDSCLHVPPREQTQEQKLWCEVRHALYSDFETLRGSLGLPETVEDIVSERQQLCRHLIENLIDINFNGTQFGNCGEGSFVMYCLAHQAGYKNLMICHSSNDHAFAIFLKQVGSKYEICLMDRWDLGLGHYACGVKVENRKLKHPNLYTKNKWYEDLVCQDPLNKSSTVTTRNTGVFDGDKWAKGFRDITFQVSGKNSPYEVLHELRKKFPALDIKLRQVAPDKIYVEIHFRNEGDVENLVKDLKKRNLKFTVNSEAQSIAIEFTDLEAIRSRL